jgi:hypothetical protein
MGDQEMNSVKVEFEEIECDNVDWLLADSCKSLIFQFHKMMVFPWLDGCWCLYGMKDNYKNVAKSLKTLVF